MEPEVSEVLGISQHHIISLQLDSKLLEKQADVTWVIFLLQRSTPSASRRVGLYYISAGQRLDWVSQNLKIPRITNCLYNSCLGIVVAQGDLASRYPH